MEYPKISVITPSYNQGEYIEKTITSILDQNYPNLEYIIMDGGSTDETVDIIKKYEDRITYWQSEKDKGQTDAINNGVARATGDIITWLCSDDYYEGNVFEKVAKAFQENPDKNLVCGNRRTWGDGIDDTLYVGLEIHPTLEETFFYGHYDQPPSFFKKEVWDEVFPLNDTLHVYMDCEMWFRYLLKYGHEKTFHIKEIFAHGLFHATSKSVNEAVPCRRVINALYTSVAEEIGIKGEIIEKLHQLDRFPYEGNWDVQQSIDIEKFEAELWKKFGPQFEDPSYIYRDVAAYFMSLGSPKAGMKNAMDAIKMAPLKIENYRAYLYCFRKQLMK